MLKKLAKKFRKQEENKEELEVKKQQNIREAVESATEAITFAEAGLHDEAQRIVQEAETVPKKILVVSHEDWFSKRVVEYALGFAERMGYEIVAMNVLELPQKSETIAPYCSLIEERFKSSSQESVANFSKEAENRNIPFTHIVKVGDLNESIKEAVRELKRVEFVISDPETLPEVAKEKGDDVIPVYAVASVS